MSRITSPAEIAASLTELWSPRVIAEVDDNYVKVAKVQGNFGWHAHADEDELFFILKGCLHIEMEDGAVELGAGQCYVVPKGVRHNPSAAQECHLMLIEKKSTLHSGEVVNERTRSVNEQLRPIAALHTLVATPTLAAQRMTSELRWDELVLHDEAMAALEDIATWLRQSPTGADHRNRGADPKPGYVSLFEGPAGAGKTLAAVLLGQHTGRDVYRVDLSKLISKYIGETEKNLDRIFASAREGGAILLFDEAEVLFGERTEVKDSHDRYANIETAFLLQSIDSHPGLIVLTSSRKADVDEAFLRRTNSIIHFPARVTK